MTNEELVIKIQQGHSEYIGDLWVQVADFINMQAGKYLDNFPAHYRDLQGDMLSQAYFTFWALLKDLTQRRESILHGYHSS